LLDSAESPYLDFEPGGSYTEIEPLVLPIFLKAEDELYNNS